MARTLSEVKDALLRYEMTTLAGVAATLAEAAESLAHTARELHELCAEEWMDAEEAAAYVRRTPKAFEKAGKRHLVSPQGLRRVPLGALRPYQEPLGDLV